MPGESSRAAKLRSTDVVRPRCSTGTVLPTRRRPLPKPEQAEQVGGQGGRGGKRMDTDEAEGESRVCRAVNERGREERV